MVRRIVSAAGVVLVMCAACGLAFPTRLVTSAADTGADDQSASGDGPCDGSQAPSASACVLQEAYGVFVASYGSDTIGDGSRASPFASIGRGISAASTDSLRVYVCADAPYDEHVVLADGVNVYGGLACAHGVWSYAGSQASVILSTAGYALRGTNLLAATSVTDMAFTAGPPGDGPDAAAGQAEASSVVAFLANSSNVVLTRVSLTATDATAGAPGATTFNYDAGTPARAGNSGEGMFADAVQCSCGDGTASAGGAGGNASVPNGQPGASSPTVATPLANGGCGDCNGGCVGAPAIATGASGAGGAGGSPGTGSGTLSASGWQTRTPGTAGGNGSPGQGGGGGGADNFACAGQSPTVPGGGGGCGGCGGGGGLPGGAGGSSFALLVYASTVTLDGCTLTAGNAGGGGPGGEGQPGQPGGALGPGYCCDGTAGGNGGSGGRGGGGAGGLSYAVGYSSGTVPPTTNATTFRYGASGAGGAGGSGQDGGPTADGSGPAGASGASTPLP